MQEESVDDLLTGNEHFSSRSLLNEGWRVSMNWSILVCIDWATFVDWLTNNINDSSEGFGADGHHDGVAGVLNLLTTDQTFR